MAELRDIHDTPDSIPTNLVLGPRLWGYSQTLQLGLSLSQLCHQSGQTPQISVADPSQYVCKFCDHMVPLVRTLPSVYINENTPHLSVLTPVSVSTHTHARTHTRAWTHAHICTSHALSHMPTHTGRQQIKSVSLFRPEKEESLLSAY